MTSPSRFSFRPVKGEHMMWNVVRLADGVTIGGMSRTRYGYMVLPANAPESARGEEIFTSRDTAAGNLSTMFNENAAALPLARMATADIDRSEWITAEPVTYRETIKGQAYEIHLSHDSDKARRAVLAQVEAGWRSGMMVAITPGDVTTEWSADEEQAPAAAAALAAEQAVIDAWQAEAIADADGLRAERGIDCWIVRNSAGVEIIIPIIRNRTTAADALDAARIIIARRASLLASGLRKYRVADENIHGERGADEPDITTDAALDEAILSLLTNLDDPEVVSPLGLIASPIIVSAERALSSLTRLVLAGKVIENAEGWRIADTYLATAAEVDAEAAALVAEIELNAHPREIDDVLVLAEPIAGYAKGTKWIIVRVNPGATSFVVRYFAAPGDEFTLNADRFEPGVAS